jgi:hypothetical protein
MTGVPQNAREFPRPRRPSLLSFFWTVSGINKIFFLVWVDWDREWVGLMVGRKWNQQKYFF